MYMKIGGWCFRHRRATVIAWIVLIVALFGTLSQVGSDFGGDPEPPESESADAYDIMNEYFTGFGAGQGGTIVFRADDGVDAPAVRAAMEEIFAFAEATPDVTVTSPYEAVLQSQVAESGPLADKVAYARVELGDDVTFAEAGKLGRDLYEMGQGIPGVTVEIGGQALSGFEPPQSETIGLAFAIVILIVSFGSVLAMGLPVAVALAGVSSGIALSSLLSNVLIMPDFATTIGAMIGLGVGIDYALFIVTRYRENLHLGDMPEVATRSAMDTAGRAVVFAGITVVVSLLGLLLIGLPFVAGLGVAASVTVSVTMLSSVTLLPALLGFAQLRIEVTKWRGLLAASFVAVALLGAGLDIKPLTIGLPLAVVVVVAGRFVPLLKREVPRRVPRPLRETGWHRWSQQIQKRPWRFAIGGTLLLGILAVPMFGIRLGFSDEGNFSEETTTRRAYDLLADGFGPGFNGPFVVVSLLDGEGAFEAFQTVRDAVEADPGVAAASPAFPNNPLNPRAAAIQVIPASSPQDAATEDLVQRLRDEVIPAAVDGATSIDPQLTGFVVVSMDFSDYLGERSLVFFGVVLLVSFVLLMAVFRSLLVPLKAVIMNMLSIAGAYGAVVAIFQWGWLSDITTIHPAPIEPFIPMMMFAIVFGLSMDYEVFLLSRIREEYSRTGDAFHSVADGLAATARVISAAAAIMVVVFGSFLLEDNRILKVFGTGLALAVFLDATLVRMLLVPATMELLGKGNWWIPRWLDRVLPQLNVEGTPRHTIDELLEYVPAAPELPVVREDVPTPVADPAVESGTPSDTGDAEIEHERIGEMIARLDHLEHLGHLDDGSKSQGQVTADDLGAAVAAVAEVFSGPIGIDDDEDGWDVDDGEDGWDVGAGEDGWDVGADDGALDVLWDGDATHEPVVDAAPEPVLEVVAVPSPPSTDGLVEAARQPWTVRLRRPEA